MPCGMRHTLTFVASVYVEKLLYIITRKVYVGIKASNTSSECKLRALSNIYLNW